MSIWNDGDGRVVRVKIHFQKKITSLSLSSLEDLDNQYKQRNLGCSLLLLTIWNPFPRLSRTLLFAQFLQSLLSLDSSRMI
jgi:hypothetical protein